MSPISRSAGLGNESSALSGFSTVSLDGIDKLYMMVNMRSNDCVFGYLNDKGFADYVFNRMLNELQKTYPELQKGVMFWKADNFHVYPRHFKFLE